MATRIQTAAGQSPDRTGRILRMTEIERKAAALYLPFAATKRAIWIDVLSDRFYRNGGPADDPAKFRLLDRVGDRELTPNTLYPSHPIMVTDTITGKPCMVFGAGGVAPNALGLNFNGGQVTNTQNAGGDTDNDAPLFLPATGYSAAIKMRLPAASGSADGIAFPATIGGAILGSRNATTNDNCVPLFVNPADGLLQVRTKWNVISWLGSVDLRDGTWHTIIVAYDYAGATVSVWIDGVLTASAGGVTISDVQSTTGSDRLSLGAFGPTGAPTSRFVGILSHVNFLPGPVLANADNRAAVLAMLATR